VRGGGEVRLSVAETWETGERAVTTTAAPWIASGAGAKS
jgi:hypothetical protein